MRQKGLINVRPPLVTRLTRLEEAFRAADCLWPFRKKGLDLVHITVALH